MVKKIGNENHELLHIREMINMCQFIHQNNYYEWIIFDKVSLLWRIVWNEWIKEDLESCICYTCFILSHFEYVFVCGCVCMGMCICVHVNAYMRRIGFHSSVSWFVYTVCVCLGRWILLCVILLMCFTFGRKIVFSRIFLILISDMQFPFL